MFKKLLIFSMVISMIVLSLAGCKKDSAKASATNAPLNNATARTSSSVSTSPKSSGTQNTSVNTSSTSNNSTQQPANSTPIPKDLLGKPNASAVVLYDEQFNSGAADNENADYVQPETMLFENGKMVFAGVNSAGYSSAELFSVSSYQQLELHTKIWSNTVKAIDQKAAWMATFVGCRLPETQAGGQPHSSGTWISLNGGPKVNLYSPGGVVGSPWNIPAVSVTLPFNAGVGNIVKIVDAKDIICFYVADSSDKDYLAFKLVLTADKVTVFDNAGTEIYSCANSLEKEGYFKIFNHTLEDAGENGVDYYVIKGTK